MKHRINKFLAQAGFASRRKSEQLIEAGRVTINGQKITSLAHWVEDELDQVCVDGKAATLSLKTYILLNKPLGYVCTNSDPQGRPKAIDLVASADRLFTVGRLDINTEGLILLTNDGQWSQKVAHSRYRISKTYVVELNARLKKTDSQKIEKGLVWLEDGKIQPAEVSWLSGLQVKLVLFEGRKREVRRIFKTLGYRVIKLKRIAIGRLTLGSLKPGEFRYLSLNDLRKVEP